MALLSHQHQRRRRCHQRRLPPPHLLRRRRLRPPQQPAAAVKDALVSHAAMSSTAGQSGASVVRGRPTVTKTRRGARQDAMLAHRRRRNLLRPSPRRLDPPLHHQARPNLRRARLECQAVAPTRSAPKRLRWATRTAPETRATSTLAFLTALTSRRPTPRRPLRTPQALRQLLLRPRLRLWPNLLLQVEVTGALVGPAITNSIVGRDGAGAAKARATATLDLSG